MKVLIIEDDTIIAESLKQGLEQELMVVDVANEGKTGFDLASTEPYDLILLDWMLPLMDGPTVCKKLRENNNTTPVLMLTAKGQTQEKVKGFNAGADDYLTKPFAFEELLARMYALHRRPQTLQPTILSLHSLSLNTVTKEVMRAGRKVPLSRREYTLLEYLLQRAGHIISKTDLIAHVWEFDTDILPNTVEAYISALRHKIDRPFPAEKPLITTVRGFGYKLGDTA